MQAQAVASRAGMTKQQYSNIESGRRMIEVNEYVKIMDALNYKAGDHLPNSMGDDVSTYLPIVEQLRKFTPDALPRVQEMLRAAALMLEEATMPSPTRAPARARRSEEMSANPSSEREKSDKTGLPI